MSAWGKLLREQRRRALLGDRDAIAWLSENEPERTAAVPKLEIEVIDKRHARPGELDCFTDGALLHECRKRGLIGETNV